MDESMRSSRGPNRSGTESAVDTIDSALLTVCNVLASLIRDNRDPELQEFLREEGAALFKARAAITEDS